MSVPLNVESEVDAGAAGAGAAAEESCPEVVSSQSGPNLTQMHPDQRLHNSFASMH